MIAPATNGPGPDDKPLPELRTDMRLYPSARNILGEPRWTIYDPLRHRFIGIGRIEHILLLIWRRGATAAHIAEQAWVQHNEAVTLDEIERFAGFLQASGLTVVPGQGGWRSVLEIANRQRKSFAVQLIHSYVFIRIPLLRPDRFLLRTLHLVRPLASRTALLCVIAFGLAGLYLVSREWDDFRTTFSDVFTVRGAFFLAASMAVVKLCHELGHAYTAAHFGCRVQTLGVAFILGFPMLFCDVTDVWRLTSRRQRMLVDSAGVIVDIAIACLASFCWALLPTGSMKSIAFSLATAGWIFSLVMNLNPFMRFDGYYILSDAFGMENLQQRTMALGRWRLRELLFGLGIPPPEQLPRPTRNLLVVFGWGTWIYRLVLFTAIALAVYAFFFKAAGIVLFVVEIGYFIILPLISELREWNRMRSKILTSRRAALTGIVLLCVIGVLVLPWSSRVTIPVVVEAEKLALVYPPVSARLDALHVNRGQYVAKGQLLSVLSAPHVNEELALNALKTDLVSIRRARRTSDTLDRQDSVVIEKQYASLAERRDGLVRLQDELNIRAPIAGEIVEMAAHLHAGRWINQSEPLFAVRSAGVPRLRGYLDADNLWRVEAGARGRFIPDDLALPVLPATIVSISPAGNAVLDQIELAHSFGGRVMVRLDSHRQPVPLTAQYTVRARINGPAAPAFLQKTATGVLIVEGHKESLLARVWRQVLKVIVRESGV